LGRTCAIWPPGPIRKVALTAPMNFRPYTTSFAAARHRLRAPYGPSSDADGMVRGGKRALLPPGKGSPRFAAFAEPPETARKAGFFGHVPSFRRFRVRILRLIPGLRNTPADRGGRLRGVNPIGCIITIVTARRTRGRPSGYGQPG
jgi:hypothetical protein